MQSRELTKPITTETLLSEFQSRFNQTMDLSKFAKEELEDVANKIRTKIHEITSNTHFGQELNDNSYQKNQMMLDIVNHKLKEMDNTANANPILQKASAPIKDKLSKGQALNPDERQAASKLMSDKNVKEGIEQQSELILAAKDMMDKVTSFLEDVAGMKTEGMLELADRIRDEMGAEKADAFVQKILPALETAEATLTQTRTELDNGVRILTGEEQAADTVGADDMDSLNPDDASIDTLDDPEAPADDEFGAADAEAGGTEPAGRDTRESREVFETSNRLYSKLAKKLAGK